MAATTTYSRRILKLKLSRQLKQSRESMTASALYPDALIEAPALQVTKPAGPKSFSDMPGPKSYPLLGSIPHYLPGGKKPLLNINANITQI
jgi:hypothetical protein